MSDTQPRPEPEDRVDMMGDQQLEGKDWKRLRAELVSDEAEVVEMTRKRLAQLRKQRGFTQKSVAQEMSVSQARVSAIEAGQVEATEIGTVSKYVAALGGRLRLVADFGDDGTVAI
jgi:DNA-binding XRE family transcriptional regulator